MNKEQPVFIKGFKVILRPINPETDLENCLRWINNPEIRRLIKSGRFPMTINNEKEWLENCSKKKMESISLAIERIEGGIYIGNTGFHKIDWISRTAVSGTIIGDSENQNQGYGTDSKMQLLNYAFNTLNLRKIFSSAFGFNQLSLKHNQNCGYKEEGRLKEKFFVEGRYYDEIILGVTRDDWFPIWEKYQSLRNGRVK